MEQLSIKENFMMIHLPGFTYKQYVDSKGETRERIYETVYDIDIDQIEAICPSTGPQEIPDSLAYSRVIARSGRYYDINLSYRELKQRYEQAKKQQARRQLLIISS
jgi:hypothetical protein